MKKNTLLLIHGFLCDKSVWAAQIKGLQNRVNLLMPNFSGADNLEGMLKLILNDAPEKFLLAGHSMGGWLALEIIKRHPERVSKLCILASKATLDDATKLARRQALLEAYQQEKYESIAENLAQSFTYQQQFKSTVKTLFLKNIHDLPKQHNILVARENCSDILPHIKQQAVLMAGSHDSEYYSETLAMSQTIPQAQFIEIKDSGHMLSMEQPELVTKHLLQFINK